jgi:hypothetical protein
MKSCVQNWLMIRIYYPPPGLNVIRHNTLTLHVTIHATLQPIRELYFHSTIISWGAESPIPATIFWSYSYLPSYNIKMSDYLTPSQQSQELPESQIATQEFDILSLYIPWTKTLLGPTRWSYISLNTVDTLWEPPKPWETLESGEGLWSDIWGDDIVANYI